MDVLTEAGGLINGPRKSTYGGGHSFVDIAKLWSAYLTRRGTTELTPRDACAMMALMKLARLSAAPDHRDSLVDAIGYLALYDESPAA